MNSQRLMCEPDLRPFRCKWESCTKAFKRRSDLTRHYKIHTDDRPHPCTAPGCEKRFIQRSALVVHTRTHTGEKPHECQFLGCVKRFSDSSSLSRHRHVHTRKRPRRCGHIECPKGFCRRNVLIKQEHQLQQRNFFRIPRGESASDSDSSRSPSTTAQPDTPQPLQDNMIPQVSIFQGRPTEFSPSVDPLDEQEYSYDIDKLFDNDELLTTQYHCLTEQAHQSTINMTSPSLSLANTSNRGATALQTTSLFHFVLPPYGEIGHNYPLLNNFNTSSMEQRERGMIYSQQSHHLQQQMPITAEQIINHTVEDYNTPSLIKSEPWFGFGSLFV
ncbi:hypothetical protein FP744_10004000 [Trichoderma asperellum]|nr:hypothetical protein LI328DRAFT_148392 [Trichoderma asperelloides]